MPQRSPRQNRNPAAHFSWRCEDSELTLAAAARGLPWKGSTRVSSRYCLCAFDMWAWLGEREPGHGYWHDELHKI